MCLYFGNHNSKNEDIEEQTLLNKFEEAKTLILN